MLNYKSFEQYLSQIGSKIKLYRVSKGLTQADLEAKSGVSKRSISRLELGQSIQVDNLIKLLLSLDLGDNLDALVPDISKRPSFFVAEENKQAVRRARKSSKSSSFVWGEDA